MLSIARTVPVLLLVACVAGSDPAATGETAAALAAPPVIAALNVTGSPPEGGKQVFIAGTDLDPLAAVTFDGIDALSISAVPASGASLGGLLVVTPPHPEGFVDVTVVNPDGQAATWPGFHYGPAPVITSVSPTTNVRTGTVITITGANFADVLGVAVGIGPVASVSIVSKSSTQLVVSAPKLNQGTYQLWVANFDSQFAVAAQTISVSGGGGGGGGGSGH